MESKLSGREEHKLQIEQSIQKKIEGYPEIIREYYFYLRVYSSGTKKTYIEKLIQFFQWCYDNQKIDAMTSEALMHVPSLAIDEFFYQKSFAGDETIKETTQTIIFTAVNSFYEFLVRRKYIAENPIEGTKRPKVNKQNLAISLSHDEIHTILQTIEEGVGSNKAKGYQRAYRNRDKLLFLLPLTTGVRVSALSEMDLSKINLSTHEFSVIEKRDKMRTFGMGEEVFSILMDWIQDREQLLEGKSMEALFITCKDGTPHRISVRSIQRIINKYSQCLDVNLSPHKLRRSYGTQFYRLSGNDIIATAQQLGHDQIETTKLYVEPDAKLCKEVDQKISQYIWD